MNPLKISIRTYAQVQESYLYGGNIFLILKDGTLRAISIEKVIKKLFDKDNEKEKLHLFRLAFLHNNWYFNPQATTFFSITMMKNAFKYAWSNYINETYSIELKADELTFCCDMPTMPIFDMRLYGMRLFVGNREGLFDAGVNIDPKSGEVIMRESLERVLDARATNLNAQSGSVLISSNSEGLFHGSLVDIGERLKVNSKPVRNKSLRTGWSGFDVVNYESQSYFDYLKTQFERTEHRAYRYSSFDENSKKIQITEIGAITYTMDDLLYPNPEIAQKTIFAFNSPNKCFFYLNDGQIVNLDFDRNNNSFKLKTTHKEMPSLLRDPNKVLKPVSANVINTGCVLEYTDSVCLVQFDETIQLENTPVITVKTYPTSIRYKNLISVVTNDCINLYSVFPFKN